MSLCPSQTKGINTVKAAKTLVLVAIATGLFAALTPAAFAQGSSGVHPWLEDDFIISVGGFYPRKKFKISVDGESSNQEIDFDRDAAVVDEEATAALNFRWKFGEKWSVAGQYYATRDSRQLVLEEDITWRDNVLRAGSNIGAGADLDLVRVFLGREFFTAEPYHEFGLGLGLHWLQVGAFVEGEMFVNNESRGVRRRVRHCGPAAAEYRHVEHALAVRKVAVYHSPGLVQHLDR